MGCGVSVAVPPALVRVPSQRSLAPNVASVTSVANDKGDNEMILAAVTDLLAFALQLRKRCYKSVSISNDSIRLYIHRR